MEFTTQHAKSANAPVWSRAFLQPLAPGALTMFSQSLRRARPIVYVFWATSAMMGFMGVVKPF